MDVNYVARCIRYSMFIFKNYTLKIFHFSAAISSNSLTKWKGEDRPAIAIRFEDIPFYVPFQKEKLMSKIQQMNKKSERDIGENNCAFQFRNGKAKSVVIYLDAFKKVFKII